MKVKITFIIKAQTLGDPANGSPGAGMAAGQLFEIPFYEIKKNIEPGKFRPYLEKLRKGMAGFSRVLDFLNLDNKGG